MTGNSRFPLLAPPNPSDAGTYQLRALSARVERNWDEMANRIPKAVQACYDHLANDPYRRIPRRVFPLKGRRYRGLWEYEVTGSNRLYYLPDAQNEPEMIGRTPKASATAGSPSVIQTFDETVAVRVCLVLACGYHIPPPPR